MAFARPTLPELIDRIQQDLTTRLALAGAVLRRSVVAVLSRVLAGAAHLLHGHLDYLSKQLFPDTSDADFLERQAGVFGLSRIAATYAAGNVTFTGTNGTLIPAGTTLLRADGAAYTTTAPATIATGTATAAVTAAAAGMSANADVGVQLSFESSIAGVNAAATVASGGLTGGTDEETDDGLRVRLLTRMQQPPQGGSEADYITWAKEVAGVTRAWVYPLELGAGTVTVRFVRDGDGTGAAIIPDAGEVSAVLAYIAARRPVTAAVTVVAPIATSLNLTIHISPDTSTIRAAVQAELEDLLAREGEPGATLLVSQIRLAVGVAEGVEDYNVTVPAADVTYTTGQLPTLGVITWV